MNKSEFLQTIFYQLKEWQDATLSLFNAQLLPTVDPVTILGIRTPQLRQYAKQLAVNPDINLFLDAVPHQVLEENILHGLILNYYAKDVPSALRQIDLFLPYIDNWLVCDLTCAGMKIFKKQPDIIYDKILQWLHTEKPYSQRFGLVALLDYYLDDKFKPEVLSVAAAVHSEDYYVNMAVAWLFSTALIKQYEEAIIYFEPTDKPVLSKWIHNKSIQKSMESFRIDTDKKNYLKKLKLK